MDIALQYLINGLMLGTMYALVAVGFTLYVLIRAQFEERDLRRVLGAEYDSYRRSTPMLLPRLWRASSEVSSGHAGR